MSPTRTVFPGETGGFGFTSVQDVPQEGLRPITDVGGFLADEGDNGAFPLLEPLGSSTAEPEPLAESDDYDFNPTDVDMDEPEEATPGEKLPQATARQYSEPYIYQLSSEDNANRQAPGVILAFFDFPGEAIRRSPSSEITAYDQYLDSMIKNADGLIFMFDPSTLEMVKGLGDSDKAVFTSKTLPGGEAQWSFTIRQTPEMILRDFQNSYFPNSKLNKPVAFVLSKADAVRDYLIRMKGIDEKEVSFLEEGVYALDSGRTGVYETELREASERILEFLNERGLSDQYKRLLNNEDDGVWMCVSSTGLAPDSNGTLYQMHGVPVHVIDPVEWILYRKSVNSRS